MLPQLEYFDDEADDELTRPRAPSPYPPAPKQYASGVQRKAAPPRAELLSDLFGETDDCGESTGSDVAPIHRLDGSPVLPQPAPFAVTFFHPAVAIPIEAEMPKNRKASLLLGGILGIACGILIVSIANGTITAKNSRSALARATVVVDAILAHH